MNAYEKLGEAVAEALSPTEMRVGVERMQQENDATIGRLGQQGVAIDKSDIISGRLLMLTEHLLGDMDDPRRLTYEHAVQVRFAQLLADLSSQVTRAKLLDGVRIAPPNGQRKG